jgi:hypothetical protein
MFKSLFMIVASVLLIADSCGPTQPELNLDKTSPNGIYRVKVSLWQERVRGTLDYRDHLKVQYLKGQEVISTYETEDEDQYESSVRESTQVIEWLSDNVLRMGRDRSDQPFSDELIVSNNTDENFSYFGISYGKYQSFRVFDIRPRSKVTVYASPEFKPDHTSNYSLGYGGQTQSGKTFEGTLARMPRKSPADGPLKFEITIEVKDLRSN